MSSFAGRLSSGPRLGAASLPRVSAGAAVTSGVAILLAGTAFVAGGGQQPDGTAGTEIALQLLGATLVATALVKGAFGRLHGGLTLLALAALAALCAISITWSLSPADSWDEANRTFSYVAVLAGSMALVRLLPGEWAAVLRGVALAVTVVCAWTLLTKVFPDALAPETTFARIRAPFGYWNAVGVTAALGVPPLLWLAARRTGLPVVNALAWPALGIVVTTLLLSYSRGALIALFFGLVLWFAVVPLRLRAAVPLLGTALVAGPLLAWAFARDALSEDLIPLSARADAGHDLGALLLLMTVILLLAGLATTFWTERHPPGARARRATGATLLGLLAAVPLVVLVLVATADGGLSGQTKTAWDRLTNPAASTPSNTPDRLNDVSSVRARYWREGLKIYADRKSVGAGAGAYRVARTRFRGDEFTVRHAHGYVVQTLADLGLVGLGLSLLGALAWIVAAIRSIGLRPRDRGLPFDPERIGLITMAAVVVTFAVHSAIDWTWYVPADAAIMLLCAGWVAARGPLRRRDEAEPARSRPTRARVLGAVAVALLALTAVWATVMPLRAVHAEDAAADALARDDLPAASRAARDAERHNPLSVEPLWLSAVVADARGDKTAASRTLERAARLQPANAESWRRLGRYRLSALNEPEKAVEAFKVAYYFDPDSVRSASDLLEASRAVKAQGGGG